MTGALECHDEMSDPRVTGVVTVELKMRYVQDLELDYFTYDGAVLRNDEGTWRGNGFGSEFVDLSGQLLTNGYVHYVGEGAYGGLVYNLFYAQGTDLEIESGDVMNSYVYVGWIEPGE